MKGEQQMEIIEAFAAKNKCYQAGAALVPRGLMLHSIGTPQPSAAVLARYFDQYQPGGQSVCVHAFAQADGTVYQTLPWEMRGWHCGGAANNTHIGIEMTEPGAGMAYADRFPRIVFNLTGGWENDDVSGFFRSPFSYVAGTLASPIFGFGRKQARYKAALAAYDEARLGYEQKVLTVFKEANDAVVSYRSVRRTAALKVNLRDAARKYVELAQLQYRGGSINYIDVLDAQRRYFDAQIGVSNAVRDEHLALVDLYKALGGGWAE